MNLETIAILKSLAYTSLFDFPLTKEELWQFLISNQPIEREKFENALKSLPQKIILQDGFYSLVENRESIRERRQHISEVQKKMRIAKRAAYYLSYIPTISLIGVSGGVAMGKAEKTDDVDFFIVTKKNTLFMTRLWIQAILEILRLRRKRQEKVAQDKVCVNLLIDESQLSWPESLQDVYTAHEIIHMKPLFERKNTYHIFIEKNKEWVRTFFPNAFTQKVQLIGTGWRRNYVSLMAISSIMSLRPFEKIVQMLQRNYMKRSQTTETVTSKVLAFHPIDYRSKTLSGLNTKLKVLGLLTNK